LVVIEACPLISVVIIPIAALGVGAVSMASGVIVRGPSSIVLVMSVGRAVVVAIPGIVVAVCIIVSVRAIGSSVVVVAVTR
jgi:hypothetical protein